MSSARVGVSAEQVEDALRKGLNPTEMVSFRRRLGVLFVGLGAASRFYLVLVLSMKIAHNILPL
jgi:hypothetical protein